MNKTAMMVVCASLAVVTSFTSADAPPPETLDKRVEALEKELLALRHRCDESSREAAQARSFVDTTAKYLIAQSESAQALGLALDESEKAGFTFGINPESRKILLSGLRDHVAALQKDLPKIPEPAKPTAPPARLPPKGL